ncbi:MAG: hypothetical protein AABW65_03725 [Nanoarchaeota archaeon]
MSKPRCELCNRDFKNEEGLMQHNSDKHSSKINSEPINKLNYKKVKKYIIIGIFLIILIWLLWMTMSSVIKKSNSCLTTPAHELNIGGHKDLALHIHSTLDIIIDGKKQFIPASIGIAQNIMRPIHTHDGAGEVHIEGPCRRDFTIGEFFKIWGKKFDSQCIFDSCTDKGIVKMKINGNENSEFEKYIMKEHDKIVIEYTSNK